MPRLSLYRPRKPFGRHIYDGILYSSGFTHETSYKSWANSTAANVIRTRRPSFFSAGKAENILCWGNCVIPGSTATDILQNHNTINNMLYTWLLKNWNKYATEGGMWTPHSSPCLMSSLHKETIEEVHSEFTQLSDVSSVSAAFLRFLKLLWLFSLLMYRFFFLFCVVLHCAAFSTPSSSKIQPRFCCVLFLRVKAQRFEVCQKQGSQ